MKQFFHDWVHLTEGEMFFKYWWLWLSIIAGTFVYASLKVRK